MQEAKKDYSSISPSATSLLLMKGYTNIPYAKETAARMQGPEAFDLSFDEQDPWFWMRVMHFEMRYWSIDQLLREAGTTNVLELSSGFSFRGLDLCARREEVHFIDTDLPEVISAKRRLMEALQLGQDLKGRLELQPLNALDEAAFLQAVERFGPGPLTIVNEGLLMYLNMEEKTRLSRTIRNVLQERSGCWITADIYVQRDLTLAAELPMSEREKAFFDQHNLEENKFHSYEAAEDFFREQGLGLVREAVPDYEGVSVMPRLLAALPEEIRARKEPLPKIQATWMLQAV